MSYRVTFSGAARRALSERLPVNVATAVMELCTGALAENPHRVGKRLQAPLDDTWSARRGPYRVLFSIEDEAQHVVIMAVETRRLPVRVASPMQPR